MFNILHTVNMMDSSSGAHNKVTMEPWDLNFKSKIKKSSKYLDFIYLLLSLALATVFVLFFKHHPWCSLNFLGSSGVKCSLLFVSLGGEALTPLRSWQMTQIKYGNATSGFSFTWWQSQLQRKKSQCPNTAGGGQGRQAMHSTCQGHREHCGRDSSAVTKP